MAAEPIHVDPGDEVPTIIERIRRSSSDEVQLVLPSRARFGQSRFNFQLLKQYSTRLGKRVAVWSPDPEVQRLAEESGFGGFSPDPGARAPGLPVASASPQRAPRPGQPQAPGGRPFPARPNPLAPGGTSARATAAGMAANPYGARVPARAAAAGVLGGLGLGRLTRPGSPADTARIRIGEVGRRLPGRITQYQPARYALYAGAVLVLLAGVMAVLFYVPTARVTLVAQAQPFSTPVDITADTTAKSPVHVRVVTITNRTDSQSAPATGQKVVPGQTAAGQFTYVNNCPTGFQIANGQRLIAANGLEFAQMGDALIANNSQQTVSIRAAQTGQASNVGAGQITAIKDNPFPNCLTGANEAATAGGTDDQKQTVIQSSDIQGARGTLEQRLRTAIINDLTNGAQKGETLVGPPQFTGEVFNTTHNVDDNVPSFTATLTLNAEGDYYLKDDVDRVFTQRLASKVPRGQQLTTNKVAVTAPAAASPGGHLEFNGSATGYIAPTIDIEQIKTELAGKPPTQAHDLLTRLPIQRSVISQSPPLPLMPLSASRIYIDYGVEATAPATSS
jgi:Baseplate J-like protein